MELLSVNVTINFYKILKKCFSWNKRRTVFGGESQCFMIKHRHQHPMNMVSY